MMDTISDVPPALAPGFDQPVFDSIKVFRVVADAMAHPGEIKRIDARPPAPAQLMPAAAALSCARAGWTMAAHTASVDKIEIFFMCQSSIVGETGGWKSPRRNLNAPKDWDAFEP